MTGKKKTKAPKPAKTRGRRGEGTKDERERLDGARPGAEAGEEAAAARALASASGVEVAGGASRPAGDPTPGSVPAPESAPSPSPESAPSPGSEDSSVSAAAAEEASVIEGSADAVHDVSTDAIGDETTDAVGDEASAERRDEASAERRDEASAERRDEASAERDTETGHDISDHASDGSSDHASDGTNSHASDGTNDYASDEIGDELSDYDGGSEEDDSRGVDLTEGEDLGADALELTADRERDEGRLPSILESLLFASDKPLRLAQLKKLVGERSGSRLRKAVDALREARKDTGIVLVEVDGGYQLRTHASNARWVRRLEEVRPIRMSRAALEVLAVVAYRQPTTRVEIDQIRGVDSGPVLKQLLARDLLRIVGRKDEVGKPFLYGTTKEFLSFFSLSSLADLPSLRDVAELAQEEIRASRPGEESAQATIEPPEEDLREVEADEIAPSDEDAEELDEGDEEVLDALTAASEAARGADRVKRSLRKMAAAESPGAAPGSDADKMLSSLQDVIAVQRKRRRGPDAAGAALDTEGDAFGEDGDLGLSGAQGEDEGGDGAGSAGGGDPERRARLRAQQSAMEAEIAEEERVLGELDDLLGDDPPGSQKGFPPVVPVEPDEDLDRLQEGEEDE